MKTRLILALCLVASAIMATQSVKTINGIAIANVKTVDGVAIANVKTVNGVDNTSADPNIVFLAYFEGADGATSFTSTIGPAMTAVGGAALTTAKSKYGSTSLYLDGSGDYVSIAADSVFSFGGTDDFCVEMWAWLDSSDVSGGFWCITNRSHYISPGNTVYAGNGVINAVNSSFTAYDDKWTHIAHTRSGGVHRLFFDGTLVATSSSTTQVFGSAVSAPLIGRDPVYAEMKMWVDSIRIYKGVPKYTTGFTPAAF